MFGSPFELALELLTPICFLYIQAMNSGGRIETLYTHMKQT